MCRNPKGGISSSVCACRIRWLADLPTGVYALTVERPNTSRSLYCVFCTFYFSAETTAAMWPEPSDSKWNIQMHQTVCLCVCARWISELRSLNNTVSDFPCTVWPVNTGPGLCICSLSRWTFKDQWQLVPDTVTTTSLTQVSLSGCELNSS